MPDCTSQAQSAGSITLKLGPIDFGTGPSGAVLEHALSIPSLEYTDRALCGSYSMQAETKASRSIACLAGEGGCIPENRRICTAYNVKDILGNMEDMNAPCCPQDRHNVNAASIPGSQNGGGMGARLPGVCGAGC